MNAKLPSKLILGSYVPVRTPDYLVGTVAEAKSYGNCAMMFFLGSPRRFDLFSETNLRVSDFHQALKKADLSLAHVFVHLPYLINLGNIVNPRVLRTSLRLIRHNLMLCTKLEITKVVLHPGASLTANRHDCLRHLAFQLDKVLDEFPTITICLETMSGKGTELGKNFDELQFILRSSRNHRRLAICFDLCHLYSAGYNLKSMGTDVISEFDQKIGLDKLALIHVNDNKNAFNSRTDQHANLGQGSIGFEAISTFLHHPKLQKIPMVLETPYLNGNPLYRQEIARLQA